jgi:hypothetical protein
MSNWKFLFLTGAIILLANSARAQQAHVLVNAGIGSSMVRAQSGSAVLYGAVGQATAVVPARNNQDVLHHGILHPTLLVTSPKRSVDVEVFPNPTSGWVQVQWKDGVCPSTIELLDRNGNLVQSIPFAARIDLSSLPAASYSLRFLTLGVLLGTAEIVVLK